VELVVRLGWENPRWRYRSPDGERMTQQARNLAMELGERTL
jgi:hypothetical protein